MLKKEYILPEKYRTFTDKEIFFRIKKIKKELGKSLLILAHHYQRDEVYQFADFTGDSLKLSQKAANSKEAKHIVFCGVHFMAETADILTKENQIVTLPDPGAGCPMADMAPTKKVEEMWRKITSICDEEILPITYVNSSAAIKAFCAEQNGTVCTSTNAKKILSWAIKQNKKILFLPDRHLGGNIARSMKVPESSIITLSQEITDKKINDAKVLLWQGHCPVHNRFKEKDIYSSKKKNPSIKLIAHPECPKEVFEAADATGSTEQIIQTVKASPSGSKWLIATEVHLVERLKKQHPDKHIETLTSSSCMCSTMDRISPEHLLWNLETIKNGNPINQIKVKPKIAQKAKKALSLMLELS